MVETTRHCPDCGLARLFQQHHPAGGGCPDSPDGCCAEWYCTGCGAAILIGFWSRPVGAARTREPGSRVA